VQPATDAIASQSRRRQTIPRRAERGRVLGAPRRGALDRRLDAAMGLGGSKLCNDGALSQRLPHEYVFAPHRHVNRHRDGRGLARSGPCGWPPGLRRPLPLRAWSPFPRSPALRPHLQEQASASLEPSVDAERVVAPRSAGSHGAPSSAPVGPVRRPLRRCRQRACRPPVRASEPKRTGAVRSTSAASARESLLRLAPRGNRVGRGAEPDRGRSLSAPGHRMFVRQCEGIGAYGCYALARMHATGRGMPASEVNAKP